MRVRSSRDNSSKSMTMLRTDTYSMRAKFTGGACKVHPPAGIVHHTRAAIEDVERSGHD